MPRTARWSLALLLLLVPSCQQEPTAPGADPLFGRANPKPPPPPTLEALAPIDLDEGMVQLHHGYGVNDSGWVFVSDNIFGPGLVWLTLAPHASTRLPAGVVNPQGGNGRGDYIAYDEDAVMLRGASGWTLSPSLHAPTGWPDTVYLLAINDARLVVGWAKDPNRSNRLSPLAWTYDGATGSWTPFTMSLPAVSNPASCQLRGVVPRAVNDAGKVVGYATEDRLSRKAVCPQRAIVWETVTGPAAVLPMAGTLAGYDYTVDDVNERGDVAGTTYSGTDYRAVRWRSGTATIEVLNGYYAGGDAIDECGRVLARQGYIWEADGSVVRRLVAPPEFTGLKVRDGAGTLAVGEAYHSTLGWHALVWTLPSCTAAP